LISTDELEFDTRYRYRVRWSIPTRRHPIPRATASVYFTIEVSKITPKVLFLIVVLSCDYLVSRGVKDLWGCASE